jgi:hypothetical protein
MPTTLQIVLAAACIAAIADRGDIDLPLHPAVTQETIGATICVSGWTKTVRPPVSVTNAAKRRLIQELEIPEELLVDFELDHWMPIDRRTRTAACRSDWFHSRLGNRKNQRSTGRSDQRHRACADRCHAALKYKNLDSDISIA